MSNWFPPDWILARRASPGNKTDSICFFFSIKRIIDKSSFYTEHQIICLVLQGCAGFSQSIETILNILKCVCVSRWFFFSIYDEARTEFWLDGSSWFLKSHGFREILQINGGSIYFILFYLLLSFPLVSSFKGSKCAGSTLLCGSPGVFTPTLTTWTAFLWPSLKSSPTWFQLHPQRQVNAARRAACRLSQFEIDE